MNGNHRDAKTNRKSKFSWNEHCKSRSVRKFQSFSTTRCVKRLFDSLPEKSAEFQRTPRTECRLRQIRYGKIVMLRKHRSDSKNRFENGKENGKKDVVVKSKRPSESKRAKIADEISFVRHPSRAPRRDNNPYFRYFAENFYWNTVVRPYRNGVSPPLNYASPPETQKFAKATRK